MCARGAFVCLLACFVVASDASVRSTCSGFVVYRWETEHPRKAEEMHVLRLKAAKGCQPRLGGVNRLTSDSCLVLRARVCSSFRQSVIRSPAGHFSVRSADPRVTAVPFPVPVTLQTVLYIRIRWREVWHFRLRRGPLGPILPVESLRAQRHPTARTAAAGHSGLIGEENDDDKMDFGEKKVHSLVTVRQFFITCLPYN